MIRKVYIYIIKKCDYYESVIYIHMPACLIEKKAKKIDVSKTVLYSGTSRAEVRKIICIKKCKKCSDEVNCRCFFLFPLASSVCP